MEREERREKREKSTVGHSRTDEGKLEHSRVELSIDAAQMVVKQRVKHRRGENKKEYC